LVNWCAGLIADPVHRLKFLKVTARLPEPPPPPTKRRWPRTVALTAMALALMAGGFILIRVAQEVEPREVLAHAPLPPRPPSAALGAAPAVWPVERTGRSETFSNGLRIDNQYATTGSPRSYVAFRASEPDDVEGVRFASPAGIVYHTTESQQAPFDAEQNGILHRIGESTLEYVRRRAAYNFLIDRFGRVYRIVPENQVAHHAGYSVWADDQWVYLDLNESFLGVSLETDTQPGQTEAATSPAQMRAAAMLTEMLRSRYAISTADCVTHGQVSVNPSNMRVGYHTDWASSFPFEELGLPDNYTRPLPALAYFGFDYDAAFLAHAGSRMSDSAALARESVRVKAAESRIPVESYRQLLRRRYRAKLAAVRHRGADAVE
jgi:hypothetical protein